jgi:hypothetical protein
MNVSTSVAAVALLTGGLIAGQVVGARPAQASPSPLTEPFQRTVKVDLPVVEGQPVIPAVCASFAVPLGRQLTIEHVDVDVSVDGPADPSRPVATNKFVTIRTTQLGVRVEHPIPLAVQQPVIFTPSEDDDGLMSTRLLATEETHFYANTDVTVCLAHAAGGYIYPGSVQSAHAAVSLSGQLSGEPFALTPLPPSSTTVTSAGR